jgi:hypothetical protein
MKKEIEETAESTIIKKNLNRESERKFLKKRMRLNASRMSSEI